MHLHLDTFSGIAGDMLLGALVDLGANRHTIESELRKLPLGDWEIRFESRDAGQAIVGLGVTVADLNQYSGSTTIVSVETDNLISPISTKPVHSHHHGDEPHSHSHSHSSPRDPAADGTTRSYADIVQLLNDADLPSSARELALVVFERLAQAEAKAHGIPPAHVHFHEVGALDSIIDIVGSCLALEELGVTSISCTPLPLGRGFTNSMHGRIPVPAPATLACLEDVPITSSGLPFEMVTPTGAAIVACLVDEFCDFPEMSVLATGHGAGTRLLPDRPNLLRVLLGRRAESPKNLERDEIWELTCNVDDQSAEDLAFAIERTWAAGALDVWSTPIAMKKGRLGTQVSAICHDEGREAVTAALLRHTTSLGVRLAKFERRKLTREFIEVETDFGLVSVKIGRTSDGTVWNVAPEADDCERRARDAGVPVALVRVQAAAAVQGLAHK